MKAELRYAVLSSAVLAAMYGPAQTHAADLQWNPAAAAPATGSDGSGTWDNTSVRWTNLSTATNVPFGPGAPNSAIFGPVASGTGALNTNTIRLGADISAQNIT